MYKNNIVKVLLFFITAAQSSWAGQVAPKTVKICTENQCDIALPAVPRDKLLTQAIVYQSSDKPEFMREAVVSFSKKNNNGWQSIVVDGFKLKEGVPVIGFGGAFTDSAAMLYGHLSPFLKKAFINAYFSTQGVEYSLGRVPIASNDFSCRDAENAPSLAGCTDNSLYSYADVKDESLANFSLQPEDNQYKIPLIQDALKSLRANFLHDFRLFASPWSAPAWMKTNGSMVHGSLRAEFQQTWANYYLKFLEAYKQNHIQFWGLTVQNEPVNYGSVGEQFTHWQTMYSTEKEEGDFIKHYLGPALREYEKQYGNKIKLMVHDDQVTSIQQRLTMLSDSEVDKYVDGAGLHWYMNADHYYGNLDGAFRALNSQYQPSKRFILGTEACTGSMPLDNGPALGNWGRAEAYAHDIINDLNHYVSGWMDWNLLLDMQGGPNWAKNYVDAPILVNLQTQTFYLQPMYYYLGHFSKFIKPGAQLLASESRGPAALEEVAFKVPPRQGLPATIVVVVLNRDITGRTYYIQVDSKRDENKYINMQIPAHSIQTILFSY